MHKLQLKDIANIRTGHTFRGKVGSALSGVPVVSAKAINAHSISIDQLDRTDLSLPEDKLTHAGDILLTTRGSFRAAVMPSGLSAIASSSVFIISITDQDYLPEYIALLMESAKSQSFIKQHARGATIKSIPLNELRQLPVIKLPKDKQEQLVGLQKNITSQRKLLDEKDNMLTNILNGTINNQTREVTV